MEKGYVAYDCCLILFKRNLEKKLFKKKTFSKRIRDTLD